MESGVVSSYNLTVYIYFLIKNYEFPAFFIGFLRNFGFMRVKWKDYDKGGSRILDNIQYA